MIIKDEMKDNLIEQQKIISLLRGSVNLPEGYGYWFECSGKRFRTDFCGGKMVIGIYKLTAVSFCDYGDPNDTLIASLNLLKDDTVKVTFFYKDSYKLLIPYLHNSATKFKIVKGEDIKDMSPKSRLKLGFFGSRR